MSLSSAGFFLFGIGNATFSFHSFSGDIKLMGIVSDWGCFVKRAAAREKLSARLYTDGRGKNNAFYRAQGAASLLTPPPCCLIHRLKEAERDYLNTALASSMAWLIRKNQYAKRKKTRAFGKAIANH